MLASFFASSPRWLALAPICSCIHSKSAPAQNEGPFPFNTTTRRVFSLFINLVTSANSLIIVDDRALCFSGLFNSSTPTSRLSILKFIVSNMTHISRQFCCLHYNFHIDPCLKTFFLDIL